MLLMSCLLLSSEAHARAPRRFAGLSQKRVRHADHQAVGVFSLGRQESSKSLVTRSGAVLHVYHEPGRACKHVCVPTAYNV